MSAEYYTCRFCRDYHGEGARVAAHETLCGRITMLEHGWPKNRANDWVRGANDRIRGHDPISIADPCYMAGYGESASDRRARQRLR